MYKNGAWDFSPPQRTDRFFDAVNDIFNAVMLSQIATDGNAEVMVIGDTIRVTTKPATDQNQSRTGGDYNYYRRFAIKDGAMMAWSDWSCDFADYGDYADTESRKYTLNALSGYFDHKYHIDVNAALRKGDFQTVAAWALEDTLEFYERVVRHSLNL